MRVAVVFIADRQRDKLINLAKGLSRGLEAQGHQAEVMDGAQDIGKKLTVYKYIVLGTEPTSLFGGKIPEKVSTYLAGAGKVDGKRCFAFVTKSLLGAGKALQRLMKTMEKEGMYLKYSEILQSEPEAEEIGKRLHVE